MSWKSYASLSAIETRAQVNQCVRTFFHNKNVLEVETPLLNNYAVTDLHIDSIPTEHHKFLHTSPEYAMKRLLAHYGRDIYQLCKVFRDNDQGNHHHHEFTMLEWYRVGWDYKKLMHEVAELVTMLLSDTFVSLQTNYISYKEIFMRFLNIDIQTASQSDYLQICSDHSIKLNSALSIQQYQEFVLDQVIIPKQEKSCMTFIYDYPAQQAALAKLNDSGYAERFEMYLNGIELANGYQELTDAHEQQLRFEKDNRLRLQANKNAINIDVNFIAALHAGLPECAGVALGIDRLIMLILRVQNINEVLAFPKG